MQGDLLVTVLSFLDPRDLGPARAVSRAWRTAAAQALTESFRRHWRLASVAAADGAPRRPGFLERATLHSFATAHKVSRSDTFASLAVRYGVDMPSIKRVNQVISDHSLYSRFVVYVPLVSKEQLSGRRVRVMYCQAAKRDLAVVVEDGGEDPEEPRRPQSAREAERQAEALRVKMSRLLGRSMRVDKETALFYIEEAGGDMKSAMSAAGEDAAWEDKTAGPIRTAPVQRWISGEAGL